MEKKIAIVFAGGSGTRMRIQDMPKQFLEINGKPIIIYALENFQNHEEIDEIYIACIESWIEHLECIVKEFNISKVKCIIPGGNSGQETIYLALKEVRKNNPEDTIVLLHDGVRPYITPEVISENIKSVIENGNAISTTAATETSLLSKDGVNVDGVPIRKEMFIGQAPQSFRVGDILSAHEEIRKTNPTYENVSDSCTLYNMLGRKVFMVNGNKGNLKVTDPIDYHILCGIIEYLESENKDMVPKDAYARRRTKKDYE